MLSQQDYQKRQIESTIGWWRDAGVEYLCDMEPTNWLANPPPALIDDKPIAQHISKPGSVVAPPPLQASVIEAVWPKDLAELNAAIVAGSAFPGCTYGQRAIAPAGHIGPDAMIIGDCPDEEDIIAGQFGRGATAGLLKNMLLAGGVAPDFVFQSTLSLSRPATASIPKGDLPLLAKFMRHQIALIQPKILILLGSAASEALLGQDLMQARGDLHYINHDDRKTAAIATFHPRTLLAQSQLKGQAWKDLQMLARNDCL